jgi:quinol monooxygenase YgiN
MSEVLVYIDRSEIRPESVPELREGVAELVEFIEAREPQLLTYGFYIDETNRRMTVISVHPDSASLERHLEVGGPAFRKLAPLLTLTSIEVYGQPSERALEGLKQKAQALGEGGTVRVERLDVGFSRMPSRD